MLRGVRGATTVANNDAQEIHDAVVELLRQLVETNQIHSEDVGAIIFSSTPDLNATFPAAAARDIGWTEVPLFGAQEIDPPQGIPKCLRILILWNTDQKQAEIRHIYLRNARKLRLDLADHKE